MAALTVWVMIRALMLLVAYTAPQDRNRPQVCNWWPDPPMIRWDSGHYWGILEFGYPRVDGKLPPAPVSDTVAFFPLYPLMARPFTVFMNGLWALVVLTHIASVIAAVLLYLWARRRYDSRVAFWSVLLLAVYPDAMFFSTGYADGLLVMWTALALWLLEQKRLWSAALVCGLATATRPTGLVLAAVVMLWAIIYRPRLKVPRQVGRLAALGTISISGLVAFQVYLWQYYQRPDAFVAVQSNWAEPEPRAHPILEAVTLKPVIPPAFGPFKYALRGQTDRLRTPSRWNPLWNVLLVGLGIFGLVRPGPIPRVLFLLPILVFLEAWLPDPVRGGRLVGIARYQLMALPSFVLLGAWMSSRWPAFVRVGFCIGWLALQCLYLRHYVNWILVS